MIIVRPMFKQNFWSLNKVITSLIIANFTELIYILRKFALNLLNKYQQDWYNWSNQSIF